MKRSLQTLSLTIASMVLCFNGCATTGGTGPFGLASERTQQQVATPSQLAGPATAVSPPAGGYNAQFASNYTEQARYTQPARPQRRYRAPACGST